MNNSVNIFTDRYQGLNAEQKKAVDALDGPVLVLAGPGSGKTELLSLRVGNILRLTDTLPSSILCLTFTDAAAVNMRKRLYGLIGNDAYKVAIQTFHSFGTEIINNNPEYFYNGAVYKAADELAQYAIIEEILEVSKYNVTLRSFHPEHGYTFLKDILKKISELKRGGLTPEDFKDLLEENKSFLIKANDLLGKVFNERISKKTLEMIPGFIDQLKAIDFTKRSKNLPYHSIQEILTNSLNDVYLQAFSGDKPDTKPLTEWKNSYTKKNDRKEPVFSDLEKSQKQFELCDIYENYQKLLHKKGYFDFEDMLLDTVRILETYPELKYNFQEKYLYVLVDEFQDTNGVQMRLLDLLLDAEQNEGRPNILAVGDDDQSIYKFQGANLDNIMGFTNKFRDPAMVVLQKNYRSTQEILDYIRKIILTGTDRLETHLPDQIKKELIAERIDQGNGEIVEKEFSTMLEELVWTAEKIKYLTETKKVSPAQIAVIAPKHHILEESAKVLDYFGIAVAYARNKNLLEQNHIKELINIIKFVDTIAVAGQKEAEELLPVILSYPFWDLEEVEIWKLSAEAFKRKKSWLDIMLHGGNEKLKEIAQFLIKLGIEAKEKGAEEIIDLITGVAAELTSMDEDGNLIDPDPFSKIEDLTFHSPYKNYYFNRKKFQDSKAEYLELLQSLQSFIEKLRHYQGIGARTVGEVVNFIKLHEKHKLSLYYQVSSNNNEKAVNLLTAHGSKGLEFDTVFVINCQENAWIKSHMVDKISFPSNIPLAPEAENIDDKLRLFYVALSRAKQNLYLCRHKYDDKGDEQIALRFLNIGEAGTRHKGNIALESVEKMDQELAEQKGLEKLLKLRTIIGRHSVRNVDQDELLKELLNDYKLSVTHFNNFLNIVDGGPQFFLEQNLLRFPQSIGPAGAYGSAMHEALNYFSEEFKRSKQLPTLEFLLQHFEKSLSDQRLNKIDNKIYLEKGQDHLRIYYEKRKDDFNPADQSEFNFWGQGVVLGSAEITGKIDKMRFFKDRNEIVVYDYKTGKALKDWDNRQAYEKIKTWKYRNQLIFYKLLVENARDFRGKFHVRTGILEFLEPVNDDIKLLALDISDEESEKMKKLIQIVYSKIMNLDFPDTDYYDKSAEGIESFIGDLLTG